MGSVFTNHSVERSLSYSLDLSNLEALGNVRFENIFETENVGSVFTNHSVERSLSYSLDFCNLEAFECNTTSDWLDRTL